MTHSKPDTFSEEERTLWQRIDPERMPRHIAIIMDGNGRWAKQRQFSRIKGHKAAIPVVKETVETCAQIGIGNLTLYAFSKENWKRPPRETGTLMALLRQYLRLQMNTVNEYNLKVTAMGAIEELHPGIRKDLDRVHRETQGNEGMHFNIALNYSGRSDILQAIARAAAAGEDPALMDETKFSQYLATAGQPDPDLVIRTSGEFRLSNFLLWQIAYSEIWVTNTYWPDFRRKHLFQAIIDYQARHRRFGGI